MTRSAARRAAERHARPLERSAVAARSIRSKRTDVIKLNTDTIRKKELKDYRQAELKVDRLKKQLKRFHERDVPGFRVWVHKTFGEVLARQRELIIQLDEKRDMIVEIEELATIYDLSPAAAYRKALYRQAHPREAEEEDRRMAEEARKNGRGDDTHDDDPLADSDFDGPDGAWEAFAEMFERMTGKPPLRPEGQKGPHSESPDQKSAKELYRTIVRRLHPDHHGHMNEGQKNLWHETQQAYRSRDINTLYGILARCDGGEAGIGDYTPVSLIRRLTLQFKKTLRAIDGEIRKAKIDPAWDYENRVRDRRFVSQIRYDLENACKDAEWQLKSIAATLASLEREGDRLNRQSKGNRKKKYRANLSPEFEF
ncbi:MAG: hypothetical protein WCN95_14990 [bacterium]